tara:strand:+ start:1664 stop:2125 length:462 start_codon:yes stop_codon:yes gene_type:complete
MNNLIELKLDENNELVFEVNIQGTDAGDTRPKIRYIIEGKDMSYAFNASANNNSVTVDIPILQECLKEGVYDSKLEVIIGDRYFTPLKTNVEFKRSLKVTAESVSINKKLITDSNEPTNSVSETPEMTVKIVSHTPKKVTDKEIVTLKQKFKS